MSITSKILKSPLSSLLGTSWKILLHLVFLLYILFISKNTILSCLHILISWLLLKFLAHKLKYKKLIIREEPNLIGILSSNMYLPITKYMQIIFIISSTLPFCSLWERRLFFCCNFDIFSVARHAVGGKPGRLPFPFKLSLVLSCS